jgi:hypothetical protein
MTRKIQGDFSCRRNTQAGSRYGQGRLDKFKKAKSSAKKERIISKAVTELKMHAVVERRSFTQPYESVLERRS